MTSKIGPTAKGGWRYPDEVYNPKWLARIKANLDIDPVTGCWNWKGPFGTKGYGQKSYRGKGGPLHRWMYKVHHNVQLAFEQQVCHSCDNRKCCNPDHLWLGTNLDNQRDKNAKGHNYFTNKTHCIRGHEFTPENTAIRRQPGKTMRTCLECAKLRAKWPHYREKMLARQRAYRAAKRAAREKQHV